jgi:hypothetical protein
MKSTAESQEIEAPGIEVQDEQSIGRLDRAAMWISMICLVHCMALPLALALLPTLGATILPKYLDNNLFHVIFAFVLLGVGGIAFVQGFRRHGLWVPLFAGAFGTALLFEGAFNPNGLLPDLGEHLITVAGTIVLVFAHLKNRAALHALVHHHAHVHGETCEH